MAKHYHVFVGFAGCLPEQRESHWTFKDAMASAREKRSERVADGEGWPGWGVQKAKDGGDTIYIGSPTRTDYIEWSACDDTGCDPDHCGEDY